MCVNGFNLVTLIVNVRAIPVYVRSGFEDPEQKESLVKMNPLYKRSTCTCPDRAFCNKSVSCFCTPDGFPWMTSCGSVHLHILKGVSWPSFKVIWQFSRSMGDEDVREERSVTLLDERSTSYQTLSEIIADDTSAGSIGEKCPPWANLLT